LARRFTSTRAHGEHQQPRSSPLSAVVPGGACHEHSKSDPHHALSIGEVMLRCFGDRPMGWSRVFAALHPRPGRCSTRPSIAIQNSSFSPDSAFGIGATSGQWCWSSRRSSDRSWSAIRKPKPMPCKCESRHIGCAALELMSYLGGAALLSPLEPRYLMLAVLALVAILANVTVVRRFVVMSSLLRAPSRATRDAQDREQSARSEP
jgi:hypothetical protein